MLKDPEIHFSTQAHIIKEEGFEGGVCVSDIRNKTGISQPTTSQYLFDFTTKRFSGNEKNRAMDLLSPQ
jgi:hypothetical protein